MSATETTISSLTDSIGVGGELVINLSGRAIFERGLAEPVHIIEVQCGDYLGEDDIVRLEDNYGREGTNT